MQTILVPIDFTDCSLNAADYACQLAKQTNGEIILLHAFHVPAPVSEAPIVVVTVEELEQQYGAQLEALKTNLFNRYHLPIDVLCKPGFATDIVSEVAQDIEADLIVISLMINKKYILNDKFFIFFIRNYFPKRNV